MLKRIPLSVFFLSLVALAVTAKATTITYKLTIDQCSGTCGTPTSLGNGVFATVSLTQVGANVMVTETLASGEGFVKTGAGDALMFNLSATPTSISGITTGFTDNGADKIGNVNFTGSVLCSGCGNGGSSPLYGPLTFTVNGVTLANFVANSSGYYFASDIIGVNGKTGNVLDSTAGTTVAATPEPSSLFLLGSGMIGLAGIIRRRRV